MGDEKGRFSGSYKDVDVRDLYTSKVLVPEV